MIGNERNFNVKFSFVWIATHYVRTEYSVSFVRNNENNILVIEIVSKRKEGRKDRLSCCTQSKTSNNYWNISSEFGIVNLSNSCSLYCHPHTFCETLNFANSYIQLDFLWMSQFLGVFCQTKLHLVNINRCISLKRICSFPYTMIICVDTHTFNIDTWSFIKAYIKEKRIDITKHFDN